MMIVRALLRRRLRGFWCESAVSMPRGSAFLLASLAPASGLLVALFGSSARASLVAVMWSSLGGVGLAPSRGASSYAGSCCG